MKEASPLVPQGSFEAQARRKSRVRFAFYTIVAIHVLAIAGFLIIGCKREEKDGTAGSALSNSTPAFPSEPGIASPLPTNASPIAGAAPNLAPTGGAPVFVPPTPANTTVTPGPAEPPAAPAAMTEHVIVQGDTFATLAIKYGVTAKAIQDANPTLTPTKLKIGDKVKIPPKVVAVRNGGTGTGTADAADSYTVKSGDTLGKIATAYHTTVAELQKLNNLTTTQIRVGQKLKLPAKSGPAPAAGGTAPAPGQ